jgi:uncharacterized damage-inducible protein DinB
MFSSHSRLAPFNVGIYFAETFETNSMDRNSVCEYFLSELKSESVATRKCLERIPESAYDFKPHEKSMQLGYLTLLVADIPRWLTFTIKQSVIDLATFPQFTLSTTSALLDHYDACVRDAIDAFTNISDEAFERPFELKNNGQLLYSSPKIESLGSTLNHWVHHRGQLTVYMRLQNIAVPSIYGPSADERTF